VLRLFLNISRKNRALRSAPLWRRSKSLSNFMPQFSMQCIYATLVFIPNHPRITMGNGTRLFEFRTRSRSGFAFQGRSRSLWMLLSVGRAGRRSRHTIGHSTIRVNRSPIVCCKRLSGTNHLVSRRPAFCFFSMLGLRRSSYRRSALGRSLPCRVSSSARTYAPTITCHLQNFAVCCCESTTIYESGERRFSVGRSFSGVLFS
jgi:hypothetical protein